LNITQNNRQKKVLSLKKDGMHYGVHQFHLSHILFQSDSLITKLSEIN